MQSKKTKTQQEQTTSTSSSSNTNNNQEEVEQQEHQYKLSGPSLQQLIQLRDKQIQKLKSQVSGSQQRPQTAQVFQRLENNSNMEFTSQNWGGASFEKDFQKNSSVKRNHTPPRGGGGGMQVRRIQEVNPYEMKKQQKKALSKQIIQANKELNTSGTIRKWGSSQISDDELEEIKQNQSSLMNIKSSKAKKAVQTAMFYRNAIKCKICGELIAPDQKKSHIQQYRGVEKAIQAVSDLGNIQLLDQMIKHGFKLTSVFEDGNTIAHLCVKQCISKQVIVELAKRKVDINAGNDNKITPLLLACQLKKHDFIDVLVNLGANLYIQQEIHLNNLLCRDSNKRTPLMIACTNGDLNLVKYLLKFQGIDINARNAIGDDCLGIAQRKGYQQIVMLLAKRGASLRKKKKF